MIRRLSGTLEQHGKTYTVAAMRRSGPQGQHEAIVSVAGRIERVSLPRRLRFGTGILTAAICVMETKERSQ